jgi:uncharacterized membrane protein YciS (DUF1049 family)
MYNLIIILIRNYQVLVISLYIGGTGTKTVTFNNFLTGSGTVTVTGKIYLTGSSYGYGTGSCTYVVPKPRFVKVQAE